MEKVDDYKGKNLFKKYQFITQKKHDNKLKTKNKGLIKIITDKDNLHGPKKDSRGNMISHTFIGDKVFYSKMLLKKEIK